MRHNRFKHQAYTLCHMFCGYKLHVGQTLAVMEAHGRGMLRIDALTADCWIEGSAIPPLSVAHDLRSWLREDMATHAIDVGTVDAATLEVGFDVDTDEHYHTAALQCKGQIRSGEDLYTSEYASGFGDPSTAESAARHAAELAAAGRR